ncbi:hypothetical protein KI387_024784, partial [Taxus chinensis]
GNRGTMFFLSVLEHTIRIPPQTLNIRLEEAIFQELQKLFVDKIIKDLGLCVSIYDIRAIDGGFVFAGDGAPTYTIDFRLVVFRPFIGEVLVGRLKKSDKSGIYLSLGFFDDIHVPEHHLQQPSTFDEKENAWKWDYDGSELFLDLDEEVRFRVTQLKYPPIPLEQENDSKPFAPMEVIGDINGSGLGLVSWWADDGDEEAEEDGDKEVEDDAND